MFGGSPATILRTIPPRRAKPVDDEKSSSLLEGHVLHETEGVDFVVGRVAQRREMFRSRARTRALKQASYSQFDEQERVILLVQWYREQPGDLRATTPPEPRRAARRSEAWQLR